MRSQSETTFCVLSRQPMPARIPYSTQRPMPVKSACSPNGQCQPELRTRSSGRCQPRVHVRPAADTSQNSVLAPAAHASHECMFAKRPMPAKITYSPARITHSPQEAMPAMSTCSPRGRCQPKLYACSAAGASSEYVLTLVQHAAT